jgi:hypothetical protein
MPLLGCWHRYIGVAYGVPHQRWHSSRHRVGVHHHHQITKLSVSINAIVFVLWGWCACRNWGLANLRFGVNQDDSCWQQLHHDGL